MEKKKPRMLITLAKETRETLEQVSNQTGLTKSNILAILVMKYARREFLNEDK